jgi:acyl-CoA synthetase (AMP-forming)/AMP-acid ligase II
VFDDARAQLSLAFPYSRVVLLCEQHEKPFPSPFKCLSELYAPCKPGKAARFDSGAEARETAFLCYSSGTTGLPKGVMTSNWNLTSQLQALNVAYEPLQHGRDVVLGILPFSHIYGLTVVFLQPITVGVPVVVLPKFEEMPVLSAIERVSRTNASESELEVAPVLVTLWWIIMSTPTLPLTPLHTHTLTRPVQDHLRPHRAPRRDYSAPLAESAQVRPEQSARPHERRRAAGVRDAGGLFAQDAARYSVSWTGRELGGNRNRNGNRNGNEISLSSFPFPVPPFHLSSSFLLALKLTPASKPTA